MHTTSAKRFSGSQRCASGRHPDAPSGSAEQRAAAEFIGGLQRAGVDATKAGACDELLVDSTVAAGVLGVKRQTLALWRCTRSQPLRYVKLGRRVSYRWGDLRAFIEHHAHRPVQLV